MVLTLEGGSEAGKLPRIELVSKTQLLGLLGCFGLKSCEEHPEMFSKKCVALCPELPGQRAFRLGSTRC